MQGDVLFVRFVEGPGAEMVRSKPLPNDPQERLKVCQFPKPPINCHFTPSLLATNSASSQWAQFDVVKDPSILLKTYQCLSSKSHKVRYCLSSQVHRL